MNIPLRQTLFLAIVLLAASPGGLRAAERGENASRDTTRVSRTAETHFVAKTKKDAKETTASEERKEPTEMPELETVTLGAGCFWCIEAVLLRVKGVDSVVSGYMGGSIPEPTYEQVCTGRTGHAEVVQVKFDPQVLPFDQLLDVFWQLHDPTTLNRQGADVGTQYRSAIFYHSPEQKEAAEKSKAKWNESKYHNEIVTEITEASEFYAAEGYHQDYFNKNPRNGYCRANILPKLRKLHLLKDSD